MPRSYYFRFAICDLRFEIGTRKSEIGNHLGAAFAIVAAVTFSHFFFFFFRDNFSTHYPIKAFSAEAFRRLDIPFWNFAAGGGQPLAGNPNTLTFYPDNILYLFLPTHIAFNLHFLIHLIAGGLAMRALVARYTADQQAARLGGLIYVLTGPVISCLAFYNLITAVALIPLLFLAVEVLLDERSWLGGFALGAVAGLLALSGEPVTIAGGVLAAAILVAVRISQRRSAVSTLLLPLVVAAVLAVVIALPLLLSYSEISSEVERSTWRFSPQTVTAASLTPLQLAEMLIGPFRGLLTDRSERGWAANPSSRGWPPLFLSTFVGVLIIPAIVTSGGAQTPYRWIVAIFLFIALGRFNPAVAAIVDACPAARVVRYPEKFALPLTVAAVVLVTLWVASRPSRRDLFGSASGIIVIALIVLMILARNAAFTDATRARLFWCATLAVAILLLIVAGIRYPSMRAATVAVVVASLAYWAVRAVPVDWSMSYRARSELLERPLPRWGRVARPLEPEPLTGSDDTETSRYRMKARMLDPLFGSIWGTHYALDRSPDGMYYMLSRVVSERFDAGDVRLKLRWLRLAGASTLISRYDLPLPLVGRAVVETNQISRFAVPGSLPYVRAAGTVVPVQSIQQAVGLIESPAFDENRTVVVPGTMRGLATGPARIHQVSREGQHVIIRVTAERGAALVVNETYFSAWDVRATAAGSRRDRQLTIFPANLDRLGIHLPPGRWTLELRFGRRRGLVAAAWVLSCLALFAGTAAAVFLSRNRTASPAR